MQRLKRLDRRQRLKLVDIAAPEFDEAVWGISKREANDALHVLTSDRIWLVGMPAIRHVYGEVGLGWLMAPSGWPLVDAAADRAYRWLAPNRMAFSRWLGWGATEACTNDRCSANPKQHGGH